MAQKFQAGDLVQLKSGSPVMTIESAHTHSLSGDFIGSYRCTWFAGAKHNAQSFAEEALVEVDDE